MESEMQRGRPQWPNLTTLFEPIGHNIASFSIPPTPEGQKVIIRFTNNYGLEIFKYPEADFFEMTVIKFIARGRADYEFAYNTPIPDLSLGYTDKDILNLCDQVSRLK
jgi:hypothetical protein